jgi:hypothetical protein
MAEFAKWEHHNLVKLVQDLIVENTGLRYDAETLRDAWRLEVTRTDRAAYPAGSQAPSSPSRSQSPG